MGVNTFEDPEDCYKPKKNKEVIKDRIDVIVASAKDVEDGKDLRHNLAPEQIPIGICNIKQP